MPDLASKYQTWPHKRCSWLHLDREDARIRADLEFSRCLANHGSRRQRSICLAIGEQTRFYKMTRLPSNQQGQISKTRQRTNARQDRSQRHIRSVLGFDLELDNTRRLFENKGGVHKPRLLLVFSGLPKTSISLTNANFFYPSGAHKQRDMSRLCQ